MLTYTDLFYDFLARLEQGISLIQHGRFYAPLPFERDFIIPIYDHARTHATWLEYQERANRAEKTQELLKSFQRWGVWAVEESLRYHSAEASVFSPHLDTVLTEIRSLQADCKSICTHHGSRIGSCSENHLKRKLMVDYVNYMDSVAAWLEYLEKVIVELYERKDAQWRCYAGNTMAYWHRRVRCLEKIDVFLSFCGVGTIAHLHTSREASC